MPGFCVTDSEINFSLRNHLDSRCVKDEIRCDGLQLKRNTLNKFLADKCLVDTERYAIAVEGVIYNLKELKRLYGASSVSDLIPAMVDDMGTRFPERFSGPVSGCVYFKLEKKLVVFTSKLGEKAVFYYFDGELFVAGSQMNYVTDLMKSSEVERQCDIDALSCFMGYGYYLDDSTAVKGVKRLYPGHMVIFDAVSRTISLDCYWKADYSQDYIESDDGYIEAYHCAFLNAMSAIVKKNAEYGYTTVLDASGGADSRMICCAAKELGVEDVLMCSYAQSGSADARISQQLALMLDYDYVFRPLDNASSVFGVDENILMNNGATSYYHITGGKQMLEMLDEHTYGLEITGLLGDVHDGSMVVNHSDEPLVKDFRTYRVSQVLKYGKDFVFPEESMLDFQHHRNEHYWFYTRGMIFGMTSYFIRQNYTEAATPFGDECFLQLYLSTPWEKRVREHLLTRWLDTKYPDASKMRYGDHPYSLHDKVTKPYGYLNNKYRVKLASQMVFLRNRPKGMNDLQFWYNTNEKLKRYIDGYYEDSIEAISLPESIKKNVSKLFASSKVADKMLAVSLLSIVRQYVQIPG